MKHRISTAAFLLFAALPPIEGRANIIGVTETDLFVSASFSSQLQPLTTAFDRKTLPFGDLTRAEVLVHANGMQGIPFPNLPTSQTLPFASSAADASGFFGVGVSGFFFPNSLPPNALAASGSTTQRVTNNSTLTFPVVVEFFVPAPTIRLFGVGNSFPPGADPARDATAFADITLQTRLTHPDGSTVEAIPLDYGLLLVREPVSGVLFPFPTRDAAGSLSRFDEPDGSFGFRLANFNGTAFSLGNIGPGDTLELTYDYFARASTGFGETGVFAAIGDPFNLSTGGGRFSLQIGSGSVPEPPALATFALGFLALGIFVRRRRWPPLPTTTAPR